MSENDEAMMEVLITTFTASSLILEVGIVEVITGVSFTEAICKVRVLLITPPLPSEIS